MLIVSFKLGEMKFANLDALKRAYAIQAERCEMHAFFPRPAKQRAIDNLVKRAMWAAIQQLDHVAGDMNEDDLLAALA